MTNRTLWAGVLGLLLAAPAHADTVVAWADAQTNSAAPLAKAGKLTTMYVRNQPPGGEFRAFILFDLDPIPFQATVNRATLRLWVSSILYEGQVEVVPVLGPWNEATLSAQTIPPLGSPVTSEGLGKTNLRQWVDLDVTSLVQQWVSGALLNYGLALQGGATDPVAVRFDTRENLLSGHLAEIEIVLGAPASGSGSGDITGVIAGTGLTGGGTSGDVGLAVNLVGSGVATTVARSDHNHFGATWSGSTGVNQDAFTVANFATSGASAIYGQTSAFSSSAVRGYAMNNSASSSGIGVYGISNSTSGFAAGVKGQLLNANAIGSAGIWGVQGPSPNAYAGYFSGNVAVNGTLAKSAGSFKIDHPLDPQNKYLLHSFVESPDMMNIYNGNVVLDGSGQADVALPAWFEALNRDFRYQLTAIGGPAPGLYVAQEVSGNRFRIAGGSPGLKVSWQVTGIRQDPYAETHRIPVEQMKPEAERGTYLHPAAYGQPAERGIEARREAASEGR
jgi:hypothetical protein